MLIYIFSGSSSADENTPLDRSAKRKTMNRSKKYLFKSSRSSSSEDDGEAAVDADYDDHAIDSDSSSNTIGEVLFICF